MPQYETADDRENQLAAQVILESQGFEVMQTGTFHPSDLFISWAGSPYAIAEYKRRKVRYDPVKIDCSKIDFLLEKGIELGVKPVLIYSFGSVAPLHVFTCRAGLKTSPFQRSRGGRGDPVTLAYEIPAGEWKKI